MDDLARRHQQIQAELAQIGISLPGSLTSRTTRCQRPTCPERHHRCLRELSPDAVFAAAMGLLRGHVIGFESIEAV